MSDDARAKVDPPPALAGSGPKVNADELQFEALATFVRADFWCFVELMFAVLYPGQKLVYAGYLELIATVLMRSCSHVLDADRGTSARWRLHASPMPPYSMERISSSWSPARTISPAALPIRARATGEPYEIDPFRGSASSSPAILNAWSLPSSRLNATRCPKATALNSAGFGTRRRPTCRAR